MTHRLLVQYGQPTDPNAFDQHYRDVHIPLARKIPGLIRFTIAHPSPVGDGPAPYLVAELDFESQEAFDARQHSAEGQAAAGDVPHFASGGVSMSHFDIDDVTS